MFAGDNFHEFSRYFDTKVRLVSMVHTANLDDERVEKDLEKLEIRHNIQKWAEEHLPHSPLPDLNTEADDCNGVREVHYNTNEGIWT